MPSWRKKLKLLSLKGHPWRQFKLFFFVCFFFLTLNPLQPTRVTRQPFNPKPDLPGCINGRRRSWYSCLRFASVWGFWARTARTRPMLTPNVQEFPNRTGPEQTGGFFTKRAGSVRPRVWTVQFDGFSWVRPVGFGLGLIPTEPTEPTMKKNKN